jgi:catechol 2,3-dioxygenase-like lactoylglutathione lyase family enzyme
MLSDKKLMAFVYTNEPDRARAFYRDVLGLTLLEEHQFAIVFDANGTHLRVGKGSGFQPARHTVVGWEVPDIVAAIRDLEKAGVAFRRFEGMNQDEHGIWHAPGGSKIAWFPDPDDNILSLTEFPL